MHGNAIPVSCAPLRRRHCQGLAISSGLESGAGYGYRKIHTDLCELNPVYRLVRN